MDTKERSRKLKQAYELLSLSTEIIQGVLNTTEGDPDSRLDELQVLCNELDERAAELSCYTLDNSIV